MKNPALIPIRFTEPIRSIVPHYNSAKLDASNRADYCPISFPESGVIRIDSHCRLIGWCSPPYRGSQDNALVLECVEAVNGREIGEICWVHGNADWLVVIKKGDL